MSIAAKLANPRAVFAVDSLFRTPSVSEDDQGEQAEEDSEQRAQDYEPQ